MCSAADCLLKADFRLLTLVKITNNNITVIIYFLWSFQKALTERLPEAMIWFHPSDLTYFINGNCLLFSEIDGLKIIMEVKELLRFF